MKVLRNQKKYVNVTFQIAEDDLARLDNVALFERTSRSAVLRRSVLDIVRANENGMSITGSKQYGNYTTEVSPTQEVFDIPDDTLEKLDFLARREGSSRSEYLEKLIERDVSEEFLKE